MEHLIAHTDWIRDLARALTSDDATADDVVQETWLAVLRRPPRDAENPRGFLATVVRNVVRQRDRGERRRRAREHRSARDDVVADGTALLERAEIHRKLVNALMHVREPSRTALLMRYFDDRPPREIAASLGVPVETVRARLKRGLAQLRAQLDDRFDGDRRAWIAAVALLASPPAPIAVGGATITGLKGAVAAAALVGLTALSVPTLLDEPEVNDGIRQHLQAPAAVAGHATLDPLEEGALAATTLPHDEPRSQPNGEPNSQDESTLDPSAVTAKRAATPAAKEVRPGRRGTDAGRSSRPATRKAKRPDRRGRSSGFDPEDVASLAKASRPVLNPTPGELVTTGARERLHATIRRVGSRRGADPLREVGVWSEVFEHPDFLRRANDRGKPLGTPRAYLPTTAADWLDLPKKSNANDALPLVVATRGEVDPRHASARVYSPPETGDAPTAFDDALNHLTRDYAIDRCILVVRRDDPIAWSLALSRTTRFSGIVLHDAILPPDFRPAIFGDVRLLAIGGDAHLRRTFERALVKLRSIEARGDAVSRAIRALARRSRPWNRRSIMLRGVELGPGATDYRWLSVEPSVATGNAIGFSAHFETDDNSIEIRTHGIRRLTIRLNDSYLNLDAPVVVRINGRVVFARRVARSLDTLIDNFPRAYPRTIHPATITVDVPR